MKIPVKSVERLLHTEIISTSVANVEIDLSPYAAYRKFRIEWDLETVNNTTYCELFMELKLNGSWKTSGYKSNAQSSYASSVNGEYNTNKIRLSSTVSSAATEQSGHIHVFNSGRHKKGFGGYCGDSGDNTWVTGYMGFVYNSTDSDQPIDAVRIYADTNLTDGKIRVYGVLD